MKTLKKYIEEIGENIMKDKDKHIREINKKIEKLEVWGRKNLNRTDDEFWRIINGQ